MTRIMVAPLVLFLASLSPASAAAPPAERMAAFRPTSTASAAATVTIRVISGARFGPDHAGDDPAATRRKAVLTDSAGHPRDAELLEFQ